jgi:phage terminase Nu1 subunit (DNA packaging protein)
VEAGDGTRRRRSDCVRDGGTGAAGEQANLAEIKVAKLRGELVEAAAVEAEWANVLRTIRAGVLSAPSRVAAQLPHLTKHDVAEVHEALTEIGTS